MLGYYMLAITFRKRRVNLPCSMGIDNFIR